VVRAGDRDQQLRTGVGHDLVQAPDGVLRVEGKVRRPRGQHAEQGDDEVGRARDQHRDRPARTGAE
jgi:hypothetical protein